MQEQQRLSEKFRFLAQKACGIAGSFWSFLIALGIILAWGLTGPIFGFSDTWQLIINTGTTIVTFLMVFLIQNTQNRDSKAIHLKLDELIRSTKEARNDMLDVEDLSDEQLKKLHEQFVDMQQDGDKIPKPKRTRRRQAGQELKEQETEPTH